MLGVFVSWLFEVLWVFLMKQKKMKVCSDHSRVVSRSDGDLCMWFCRGPFKALDLLVFSR